MKRNLPSACIFICLVLTTVSSLAQSDRYAYAVTDLTKEGINWSQLRRLDLTDGTYSDVLLKTADPAQPVYDAATKRLRTEPFTHARFGTIANAAFGSGVAATAYDKRHDRLYFTPMFIDQLRYIDLKTMKVYFATEGQLTGNAPKATDQSNIITRMSIGDDGNGYALTNDGKQLVRFSTGKNGAVARLGSLVDDPANKDVSIHNSCTSYGGDIIADDNGNLYLFSARNHVFRIDIETKIATHLGMVTGVPATFTVNGAAVDAKNNVVLTSAVDNTAVVSVDINSLKATPIPTAAPWRTADLANGNLLQTRKAGSPALPVVDNGSGSGLVQLYPNPATGKKFSLQLSLEEGSYTIQVTDIAGRQAIEAPVNLKYKGQVENIQLPANSMKGVYLVNVVDGASKTVFSKKILVQ